MRVPDEYYRSSRNIVPGLEPHSDLDLHPWLQYGGYALFVGLDS